MVMKIKIKPRVVGVVILEKGIYISLNDLLSLMGIKSSDYLKLLVKSENYLGFKIIDENIIKFIKKCNLKYDYDCLEIIELTNHKEILKLKKILNLKMLKFELIKLCLIQLKK